MLELWADCGQLFKSYPQSIDNWHGIEPNQHLHWAIRASAEENAFPVPIVKVTAADPIKHLEAVAGESVDSIVASRHLNKIENCDELFKEAFRALKPGGKLVMWESKVKYKCIYSIPAGENLCP